MNDQVPAVSADNAPLSLEIQKKLANLVTMGHQPPQTVQGYTPNGRMTIPPFVEFSVMHYLQLEDRKVNQFDGKQLGVFIGFIFESIVEMTNTMAYGAIDLEQKARYAKMGDVAKAFTNEFQHNIHYGDLLRANHQNLLENVIDVLIAAQGAAYSLSNNTHGALLEVVNAKLVNNSVRPPDLSPFITPLDRD